ncbi:MAG: hypothetical protein H0X72_12975 [Acidobacteria bacterium]|jgi:hypothetical protein|nr:hypothetical protein [Acidobacteriota bacterium]
MKNKIRNFSLILLPLAAIFGTACPGSTNTNANVTIANTNVNITTNGNTVSIGNNTVSTTVTTSSTGVIESKEPDQYQATVALKFETSGEQKVATQPLKAEVARNGDDRRMEFAMPNGEKLIYLERGGKQLLVMPQRKQYAELTKEALGFEVRSLMMPETIVKSLNNLKGIERVGEEKIDGRDAIKYRFAATTDTKSQAGTVQTESFIVVDKETGLPLRSFTNAESQGNVQGIKGASLITEINNVRTTADPTLFAEPTDFAKVPPEQIRQQVDAFFSLATAFITQIMKSAQAQQNAPTPAPTAQ